LIKRLWDEHVLGNQTLKRLSEKYNISTRSVRRKLDKFSIDLPQHVSGKCVIVMDSCYFGRSFGVMVFRDILSHENLLWFYIHHETLKDYIKGIQRLKNSSWDIQGIACDGKRGLFRAFGDIPVQMCQFHQVAIVTRYITRNPKLEAGKGLKAITKRLCHTSH